jgi:hypothetical protein
MVGQTAMEMNDPAKLLGTGRRKRLTRDAQLSRKIISTLLSYDPLE